MYQSAFLLQKEGLKSDGQQFYQYQQNEKSFLTLIRGTLKRGATT
jgi:hypothetical protein